MLNWTSPPSTPSPIPFRRKTVLEGLIGQNSEGPESYIRWPADSTTHSTTTNTAFVINCISMMTWWHYCNEHRLVSKLITSRNEEEYFPLIRTNINNKILMDVQSCSWCEWNLRGLCHVSTALLPEKACSCCPKHSNSAIVKVAQTHQRENTDYLKCMSQLTPGSLWNRRCYRQYRRWDSTIHTAVKRDCYEVCSSSVEQMAPQQPFLRWVRPEGDTYWRTTPVDRN